MGDMTNLSWVGLPMNLTSLFREFKHHDLNLTFDVHQSPPPITLEKSDFTNVLEALGKYYTPVLVPIGFLCNVISVCIFLSTSFKKVSCTCYVAAISLCNSTFLLTLFLIWLRQYDVQVYNTPGFCQLLFLLSCTSNFLSCWYSVFLAIDRYVLLFHRRFKTLCTTIAAKIFIIIAAAFAIAIHINVSLTMDVQIIPRKGPLCLPLSIHVPALNILGKVDVFFNVIFAYLLLIAFTILSWVGMVKNSKASRICRTQGSQHKTDLMFTRASNVFLLFFICFCAPSQLIRIYLTIHELTGYYRPYQYVFSIQQLLQYYYYTGLALGGVVYLVCLDAARNALKTACLKLYGRSNTLKQRTRPVSCLATHTVVAMTEITNLKNVSLL